MAKAPKVPRGAKIILIISMVVLLLFVIFLVVTFDPGTYYFDAGPPF